MICKIVAIEKTQVLCENKKTKTRRYISKHNFYPRDLSVIKVGMEIDIKKYTDVQKDGFKNEFININIGL